MCCCKLRPKAPLHRSCFYSLDLEDTRCDPAPWVLFMVVQMSASVGLSYGWCHSPWPQGCTIRIGFTSSVKDFGRSLVGLDPVIRAFIKHPSSVILKPLSFHVFHFDTSSSADGCISISRFSCCIEAAGAILIHIQPTCMFFRRVF